MTPGDIISGVVWLAVIAGAAVLIFRSSATQRVEVEQRERGAARASDELQLAQVAEAKFVDEATSMLPDAKLSLAHLKHRYGWQDILECNDINVLHLRLLGQTIDGSDIELPNLILGRSDPDAQRLIREARSLAPAPGWPEDVEGLIQEPTVQTLLELQSMGLVVAEPVEKEPTKRYSVRFTDAGRRLKQLDALFRDKVRHPAWPNARPSQAVRRDVGHIVRKALHSHAASAA